MDKEFAVKLERPTTKLQIRFKKDRAPKGLLALMEAGRQVQMISVAKFKDLPTATAFIEGISKDYAADRVKTGELKAERNRRMAAGRSDPKAEQEARSV